jgi:hypothetical protein
LCITRACSSAGRTYALERLGDLERDGGRCVIHSSCVASRHWARREDATRARDDLLFETQRARPGCGFTWNRREAERWLLALDDVASRKYLPYNPRNGTGGGRAGGVPRLSSPFGVDGNGTRTHRSDLEGRPLCRIPAEILSASEPSPLGSSGPRIGSKRFARVVSEEG